MNNAIIIDEVFSFLNKIIIIAGVYAASILAIQNPGPLNKVLPYFGFVSGVLLAFLTFFLLIALSCQVYSKITYDPKKHGLISRLKFAFLAVIYVLIATSLLIATTSIIIK